MDNQLETKIIKLIVSRILRDYTLDIFITYKSMKRQSSHISNIVYFDQSGKYSTLAISVFIHRRFSTKGIPRLSSADRALIIMPDEIKDIIVGIFLGDALVRKIVYGFSIFLVFFYKLFFIFLSLFLSYCRFILFFSFTCVNLF